MNLKHFTVFLLVMALFLTGQADVSARPAQAETIEYPEYAPGELVVVFAEGQAGDASAQASALAGSVGAQVAKVAGNAALLRFGEDADVKSLAAQLSAAAGVRRVEPNYYYHIPEASMTAGTRPAVRQFVVRETTLTSKKDPSKSVTRQYAVPVAALRAMKGGSGKRTQATYPNDPLLWNNYGWNAVNAEILVGNNTVGKNVCVIDTGVDSQHPDLRGKIINGRDFVNDDMIPQDDNGHGTHVAGIIVAIQNNRIGIAGAAPTSRVVAVKALDAFGFGTTFDIANAIFYCANRTDVSVINMSLGGPYSGILEGGVDYATNSKNKIVVAAAGNDNVASYCGHLDDNGTPEEEEDDFWVNEGDERFYPAGFAIAAKDYESDGDSDCSTTNDTDLHPAYPNVISVGATGGKWVPYYSRFYKAPYSNYGPWVTMLAPGTDILSTLPYDKPFTLQGYGFYPRYDYLSGTSMAAPYASALFARAWGYAGTFLPPLTINNDIVNYVDTTGWEIRAWDYGWPTEQSEWTLYANIAAVMQRFAMVGAMVDANTGLPVPRSTMTAFNLTTNRAASAPVPVFTYTGENWSAGGELYTMPAAWAEIVNLPAGQSYEARGMMPNYTAVATNAFPYTTLGMSGGWNFMGEMGAPPRSANFSVVTAWDDYYFDLDALAFIPDVNDKTLPTNQQDNFIVSRWYEGGLIGGMDWDGTGSLYDFPYARHFGASELSDWNFESITVKNRSIATCDTPANAALPCYRDEGGDAYEFWVTDWGQFFDDDDDGIEDVDEMPAIAYFDWMNWPSAWGWLEVYAWKDGKIVNHVHMNDMPVGCNPGEHFWHAFDLSSNGGVVTYTEVNNCTTNADFPYGGLPSWWEPVPIQYP